MSGNKIDELMKKHPPWFMFDFHPMRFVKKLSDEEQEEEEETETEKDKK